jgi:hypothetical protein
VLASLREEGFTLLKDPNTHTCIAPAGKSTVVLVFVSSTVITSYQQAVNEPHTHIPVTTVIRTKENGQTNQDTHAMDRYT